MIRLDQLVGYCDDLLSAASFSDYAPNGLQVQGREEVRKIVCGVTASQALIDAAVGKGVDVLLVHHGFFWKGESAVVTGIKRNRLKALLANDLSLIAYHLPLDAHAELGNNAQLAKELGLKIEGRFGRGARDELAMHGCLESMMPIGDLVTLVEGRLGRRPMHLAGGCPQVQRVAWCTGAAQSYIEAAAAIGVDVFISGEVSESTTHFCREAGIHYLAAGHHVTERYGVKALGMHLSQEFNLDCEFVDIENPV